MQRARKLVIVVVAISIFLHLFSLTRNPLAFTFQDCQNSQIKEGQDTYVEDESQLECKKLGLPQPMIDIPLSPRAYMMDHGVTFNFLVVRWNKDIQPPIHLAVPNHNWVTAKRIDQSTGRMNVWDHGNLWNRAVESKPEDGIFIDVGGWIGDTAIPSAAMGIDTYVFEPVRNNTNMIHHAISANRCHVSEHLTVVNALVGDKDSAFESVYVTSRADNAAATKEQATKNIGENVGDFTQPTEMITLDSFFPPGTKVQNLKIDVQGFELQVLRGAKRLLEENKEGLHLRFEHDERLIQAAGNDPADVLALVKSIGYRVVSQGGGDLDLRAN